ncbi:MAG: hypothetical protein ACLP9S_15805 [Syntrophales bacterium]
MDSISQQEFVEHLDKFFENIGKVAKWKLNQRSNAYKADLGPMLNDVIKNLRSEKAISEITQVVATAIKNGDNEMMEYLTIELKFFDHLVQENETELTFLNNLVKENEGIDKDGDTENEAIGAGKTIKDSIDEWLKKLLPPWLRKLLNILNELLSLIKGG